MSKYIENRVIELLKTAEELYHRLILIVGKSGSGKTSVLKDLSKLYKTDPININLGLSKKLLEFTEKQRQQEVLEILKHIVNSINGIVFLDNIEILFEVKLKQDPLKLLQILSRNHTVISTWNGTFVNSKLTYAEPGHSEYISYEITDTLVVSMDDKASIYNL